MSFGKTLLNESGIEKELNSFLEYLVVSLKLDRNEVFKAMRDYKHKAVTPYSSSLKTTTSGIKKVNGVTIESSGIELDNTQVKPRGQGSTPMPFFENVNTPQSESFKSDSSSIVINKQGDRYVVIVSNDFLETVTNESLASLLKRKTLSFEEYNYLKIFLNKEQINFQDVVVENSKQQKKITNVEDIMKKVQDDINESEQLLSTDSIVAKKPTKLKLVKLTTNTAWDKDTKYVFRLNKDVDDKITPIAFGTRSSRESENKKLTQSDINDLNRRGLAYDSSF